MEKMTAMASVSSTWIPEDDLLLKNSIEAGASLEALAKGAVNFSHRFTFRELRDRWHSLLYDPDVSAQASARMAELELSGSNPSSKSSILKGNEKASEKRKLGSVRRHYYAMRKRIKNDYFNSQNLGFFEEHNNLHNFSQQEHNVTNNHGDHGGDAMIEDCLANNLGFEEKDFEILRQAFPESIGGIATTTTTATIAVDNPVKASHMEACHKSIKNDFINGSFDQNVEMKNATCINESGPTETPNENLPKTDKSSGFGGKHLFNSPVSDGSASFHTMGFSSPSTRLPLWKTLEDVSAPDMPVDENKAAPLTHSDDCDHIMEGKSSQLYGVPHMEENQPHGEYTDLPDSLLNFSNEDAILFMDVDSKDTMHDDIPNTQEADLASQEELKEDTDMASTSVSQPESLHLTEGQIICTLNKEDPDIPCNDDIFLLIHPSTLPIATDSGGPLSSSSHEKEVEQGLLSERKGKDLAPCFTRSNTVGSNALTEFVSPRSLVGSAFKRESLDSDYLDPLPGKPNHHRTPSQTRSMHTGLEITGNGLLEEDASKVELRGFNGPAMYSEMLLPLQVGSVKMIDPESVDDSDIDDQNNFDSDGDIPYFSDVEAMVLEMDLAHSQESCITSEVARYQNEEAKRMIIRLEQAARSSFQRAMSSHGALAIFYGRRLKQYIKKTEVTIGRSTDDTEVDIDLRKEGRANKISRRQAIIKMETDGSFSLKNLGSSSISLNGKVVAHGQLVALSSSCLIEIRGMNFVFEINEKYVRRFLDKQPR